VLLPIYLKLNNKEVLVVGGGSVAQRKIEILLKTGANITVISPDITDDLLSMVKSGKINWENRKISDNEDYNKYYLIFAATNDSKINNDIKSVSEEFNIPVNAVDDPENCDFFIPSIYNRGDLIISVSTSGKSPSLAKNLRIFFEEFFNDNLLRILDELSSKREELLVKSNSGNNNVSILNKLALNKILDLLDKISIDEIKEKLIKKGA